MADNVPDLRFGPGTSGGFTPAGVAAFDNLRPAAVVRELIQNALDAARTVAATPAIVRFRVTRTRRDAIPGIESYKSAFAKAVSTQETMTGGALTGQAQLVAETIRHALEREELDVLSVLDNGAGLNEQRMNALLSDGVSVKGGDATGTYGNGHSTAIPASDLRYVLYGGLTGGGHRIGAGHAVLASHVEEGEQHLRAGDGFYIRDFRAGHGTLYDYATGHELPVLIATSARLDRSREGSRIGGPLCGRNIHVDRAMAACGSRGRCREPDGCSAGIARVSVRTTRILQDMRTAGTIRKFGMDLP